MTDLDLISTELEVQGIKPQGQTFAIGDGVPLSPETVLSHLKASIKAHKKMFFDIWKDTIQLLKVPQHGSGNETTQRMFANSLKMLSTVSERFPALKQYCPLVTKYLSCDSARFSENFMSKIVDAQVGLDWVNHIIRLDMFKTELIQSYLRQTLAKSVITADISGIQGPWSNVDLPMAERVWSFSEDQEGFDTNTQKKQRAGRYDLPDTYNDPYSFEEGFVWRELRNDPYDPDKDDENPYPHRDLLYRKP